MSDWQAGDLALCVNEMYDDNGRSTSPVKKGFIGVVSEAIWINDPLVPSVYLSFPEYGTSGFDSLDFVKVTPDAETLEDRGIIEIMKKDHSHVD